MPQLPPKGRKRAALMERPVTRASRAKAMRTNPSETVRKAGDLRPSSERVSGVLEPGLAGVSGDLEPGLAGVSGVLETGLAGVSGDLEPGLAGVSGDLETGPSTPDDTHKPSTASDQILDNTILPVTRTDRESTHNLTAEKNTRGGTVNSNLLECPLCLEKLRRPKSLPCLHTFCHDCLGTYITKDLSGEMASATSFPCPICRTLTQLVNQSEDKENWTQQFPTNSLIQELLQVRMEEPCCCKPCEKKGTPGTPATILCKTCNVLLCGACKVNVHDLIHEDCEIVGISGNESSAIKCGKHSESMEYYCADHRLPGCTECIATDHAHCEVVAMAQDHCETLKANSMLDDMMVSLQKSSGAIGLLLNDFEELIFMVEHPVSCFTSINDLHQRVDLRLKGMQQDLTDELLSATKREKSNFEMSRQKCERLMSSVQNTLEFAGKAIQKNDSMRTILLYQRGQAEVEACTDLLTEIRKSYATVRIQHEVDPSLCTLDKDVPLSLGEIVVRKCPRLLPSGVGSLVTPLSKCRVKEIKKFNIRLPSDTTFCVSCGIVYLQNDQIVLGDTGNKNVKLFSSDGQYLDQFEVPGGPLDVCVVNTATNTVAVATYDPPAIHVVNASTTKLSLLYVIKLPSERHLCCCGLTCTKNGEFIVSTSRRDVCSVTKHGQLTVLRNYPYSHYSNHLASDHREGHIFISLNTIDNTSGDVALTRLSGNIHTELMEVGFVKSAYGVDVDIEGNVYLCGGGSNNVVQMSADGTNVRELLTSADGVLSPRAISVCGDKFVLTNQNFGLEQNYVKVFQLF